MSDTTTISTPAAAAAPAPAASTLAPTAPSPSAHAAPVPEAPAAAAAAPATPSTPSAPATETPAAPPASSSAPASAPAASDRPAEPKQSDFDDAGEFLTAHGAWETADAAWQAAHPEAVPGDTAPGTEEKPTETPAAETEAGDLTVKGEEDAAPVTVTAINEMLAKDPELAAMLDAKPEAKGTFYKMARQLAEAQPIAELFLGGVESAKFAKETAGQYVGLRSKFEAAAAGAGTIEEAFDGFVDQFTVRDAAGEVVKGPDGKPKLADDFGMLVEHIRKLDVQTSIAEIEQRLTSDAYPSEAAKERDEQRLLALQILTSDDEAPVAPDLSQLSPEMRAQFEERERKLAEAEASLAAKEGKQTKEQAAAARQQWNTDFGKQHATTLYNQVESAIKSLRDAGSNIPQWMLEVKAPGKAVPIFYLNVMDGIRQIIQADPYLMNQASKLMRLAPTPENLKTRVEFYDGIAKEHTRSLVLKELSAGIAKSAPAATAVVAEKPNPSVEPRGGGGAPAPATMTEESAMQKAREQLAAERGDWNDLEPHERNALAMTRQRQILAQR